MNLSIAGSDTEEFHRKDLSQYFLPHVVEQIIQWDPTQEQHESGQSALVQMARLEPLPALMVAVGVFSFFGPRVFINVKEVEK